jgi:hypothetical protein
VLHKKHKPKKMFRLRELEGTYMEIDFSLSTATAGKELLKQPRDPVPEMFVRAVRWDLPDDKGAMSGPFSKDHRRSEEIAGVNAESISLAARLASILVRQGTLSNHDT